MRLLIELVVEKEEQEVESSFVICSILLLRKDGQSKFHAEGDLADAKLSPSRLALRVEREPASTLVPTRLSARSQRR